MQSRWPHRLQAYVPASSSSIGGQVQNKFRSPYTLSMRATAGQNLSFGIRMPDKRLDDRAPIWVVLLINHRPHDDRGLS